MLRKQTVSSQSNVQWHIDTNKPAGDDLLYCQNRIVYYTEMLNDLKLSAHRMQQYHGKGTTIFHNRESNVKSLGTTQIKNNMNLSIIIPSMSKLQSLTEQQKQDWIFKWKQFQDQVRKAEKIILVGTISKKLL